MRYPHQDINHRRNLLPGKLRYKSTFADNLGFVTAGGLS